jgi:hypothetical protein
VRGGRPLERRALHLIDLTALPTGRDRRLYARLVTETVRRYGTVAVIEPCDDVVLLGLDVEVLDIVGDTPARPFLRRLSSGELLTAADCSALYDQVFVVSDDHHLARQLASSGVCAVTTGAMCRSMPTPDPGDR